MSDDQLHLDADVQAIADGLGAIESEVASLKAQPAAKSLDFTALDQAVARIKSDTPAAPAAPATPSTPADPTPAPTPVEAPAAPVEAPAPVATPVEAPAASAPAADATPVPAPDAPAEATGVPQVPATVVDPAPAAASNP